MCSKRILGDATDESIFLQDESPTLQSVPADLRPLVSSSRLAFRARFQTDGSVFSRRSTHTGNSLVSFYPEGGTDLAPGSIKYIFEDKGRVWFAVQRHLPAHKGIVDPYRHYPYFPARVYSARLSDDIELVSPSRVMSHVVRWGISEELVVILALIMVSSNILQLSLYYTDAL